MTAALAQGRRQRARLPRQVAADVHGGVPLPVGQRRQVPVTVPDQVRCLREQVRSCLAPVDQRDLVTGGERRLGDVPTHERRAADDEYAHTVMMAAAKVDGAEG
jgi:hypothetical protein